MFVSCCLSYSGTELFVYFCQTGYMFLGPINYIIVNTSECGKEMFSVVYVLLSIRLSVCLSVRMSVCLSVCLSVCPTGCLSGWFSVGLCVYFCRLYLLKRFT